MTEEKEQTLTIQQAIDIAVQHHQLGDLSKAESIYKKILQVDPHQPVALHLLGVIYHQFSKNDIAVDFITKAITFKPDYVEAYSNLGLALKELGKLDEAVVSYNKALHIKPNYAEAHYNLGIALKELGYVDEVLACFNKAITIKPGYYEAYSNLGNALKDFGKLDEAVMNYNKAITIKPDYAKVHSNLGNALNDLGKLDEAVASYVKAVNIKPDYAEAHYNLGITFQELKKYDEAEASYNKAIAIKPDYAEMYSNLGNTLKELGKLDEAIVSYNKALHIKPDYAEVHSNLGLALKDLGKIEEAVASFNQALGIKPDFAEAHSNLGLALQDLGQLNEAVASCNKAITIKPNYAEAHYNLGNALKELGKLDEAVTSYNNAIAIKPDLTDAHSNLLMISTYGFINASETYKNALRFGEIFSHSGLPISNHSNIPDPERRLRVGLVSGDFRHHPVGYLLLGVLSKINTNNIKLIAYSTCVLEDDFTAKIRSNVSKWRNVASVADKQLAESIVADGIDILVDLSGHSIGNRLPLFSWKPAPVQVTWIGSNVSTGIREIDYILCDPWTISQKEEKYFIEKPWRLPDAWLCFAPPEFDIKEGPLPALKNGFITFGCFNNLLKMNDAVVKCWSDVLKMVPNSKLLLKTKQLDFKSMRESTLVNFEKNGIPRNRLLLEGQVSRVELLASYQNVDIALDPFPYMGGITSIEALWMGIPVLSLNGGEFVFSGFGYHIAESTLHNAGLSNWIASSPKNVAVKAKIFSSDLSALAELRGTLRQRLLNSPLCDSQTFADNLTNAFREMWRIFCNQTNG